MLPKEFKHLYRHSEDNSSVNLHYLYLMVRWLQLVCVGAGQVNAPSPPPPPGLCPNKNEKNLVGSTKCVFFNPNDLKLYGQNVEWCDGSQPTFYRDCYDNNADAIPCINSKVAYFACKKNAPCSKY